MGESNIIVGSQIDAPEEPDRPGRSMSVQAMQNLFELKESNQLCDAKLILDDGSEVPVHSAILCSCSLYFR